MTLRRLTFAFVSLAIGLAGCSRSPDRPAAVDDLVTANNRGVGLMGQFDYAQARDVFARLSASHPDRLDVQVNLAVATLNRQREGDDAEAQRILQRVLSVDSQQIRAQYNLGLILLNDGRPAEALGHFLLASEHERGDAYAVYYVGQCKFQQGDAAGALDAYQRALTLNPRLRSAAYGAFQAMQRLGSADASRMLDRFRTLEADPRSETMEFKYTRMGPLGQAAIVDQPAPSAARRPPGPVFQPNPIPVAVTSPPVRWRRFTATERPSITAADIDGDGTIDLFIAGAIEDRGVVRNAVLLNRGTAGLVLDATHPLAAVPGVNAALWGDYDNDGLTDVYLCRNGANQLWRQVAKGQWADVTAAAHADGGGGSTIDGALFDADHDGDLDVLLIKSDAASELLNNDGNGTFRSLGATIGLARDRRPSTGVIVADLDGDRDADIIVIRSSPQHDVLINDRTWQYHRGEAFSRFAGAEMTAAVAGDLDAGAHPILYSSDQGGVTRWVRGSSGAWEPERVAGSAGLARSAQLALADVDGDGRLDLIGTGSDGRWQAVAISDGGGATPLFVEEGPPVAGWALAMLDPAKGPSIVAVPADANTAPLIWQPGAGRFPYVSVSLSGRDRTSTHIRSNVSGIGTEVLARAASRWTALSTYREQSGIGQSLQPLAFGTGGAPQLDFLSITWSDGVFQTELGLAPGTLRRIDEVQRQLSSCPVLFAFDGRHFAFVTDILGVGGMGTPTSPGVYDEPRPRESVLLPDGLLVARDGRYELKITEPMEEVAYIDSARLLAYDLPAGWQLVLDERKAISPPEASGEPRFYREERLPVRVVADDGEDVTRAVTAVDGIAAPPGRVDPRYIGLTADRTLTLEFDSALDGIAGDPMLVADGWIEYPYAQTLFAAWQAHAEYHAPTIEARGADGRWQIVRREFGYPAGMPRRMSLPLGHLPRGAAALRLRTTQEIYWDRLAVGYALPAPDASVTALPVTAARLARTGFAARVVANQRRPSYDYDRRAPLWDTRYPKGMYTAEGTVTELLAVDDGAVAVIGPGEEVHLEFAASLPAVRPGWTRRFVLDARGWCKDMDLYTKDGETVDPLPGRRRAAAAGLQRRYTTRYESGR
ncbi:MAG TPA: FG-GAP-like repeat-containing protein [Vicinamibacterales bacterium]|jgi:Tfp pilus assembly protein PilF